MSQLVSLGIVGIRKTFFGAKRLVVLIIGYSFLCSIILLPHAFGRTTYYISSSGNDANNGTSTSTPWKTVARTNWMKMPALQPGDSLLFKRGDAFDGVTRIKGAGTSELPIYVGAYGLGSDPYFVGDCRNLTWTPIQGRTNYWKAYTGYAVWGSMAYGSNGAWVSQRKIGARPDQYTSVPSWLDALPPGSIGGVPSFYDTLYWHKATSGAPSPDSMFFTMGGFQIVWSKNIIIENLDLTGYQNPFYIFTDTNITVRKCRASSSEMYAFMIHTSINVKVDSCSVDSTSYTAVYVYESVDVLINAVDVKNVQDTISHYGNKKSFSGGENCGFGIQGTRDPAAYGRGKHTVIQYCSTSNIQHSAVDAYWEDGDTIRFNNFEATGGGFSIAGRNCVAHDNVYTSLSGDGVGLGVFTYGEGTHYAFNNIFHNVRQGIQFSPGVIIGGEIPFDTSGGRATIYNNTIYSNNSLLASLTRLHQDSTNVTLRGNTFYGAGRFSMGGTVFTDPAYHYGTLAEFQAAGFETGSVHVAILPVQVVSFTATVEGQRQVRLTWRTLTEANNLGFEVQRGQTRTGTYFTLSGSFVAGFGTTSTQHVYSYVDTTASPGTWHYRLKQIDLDGTPHYTEPVVINILTGVNDQGFPGEFGLRQNYPNPFNPATTIEFTMPAEGHASLKVFDTVGREVAALVQGIQLPGTHRFFWNPEGMGSGVYFCRFTAGAHVETRKMILLR